MSVRSEKQSMPALNASEAMQNEIIAAQPADAALHEGAAYHAATPENPLHRTVVVSIRSSLNELCLQKSRGTWQPSQEALKSICKPRTSSSAYPTHEASFSPHSHTLAMAVQQKKYTALDGSAEVQGDLKVQSRTKPPPHTSCLHVVSKADLPSPVCAVDGPPRPAGLARQVLVPHL